MEMCDLAVETCVWPMFEIVEGKLTLNYRPKEKLPVEAYLKEQGRFRHMFQKGNEGLIVEYQAQVDKTWDMLQNLSETK